MNRKEFIQSCGMACLSSFGLTAFLQSCASANYYAKNSINEKKIKINKTEFIEHDKNTFRKYILIKNDALQFPICLFKLGDQEYSAVYMECSHRSCELHNQGSFLQCPCHGSEFSNKGIVQNPPAEQNLKTFQTTTDHESIFIHL